MSGLTMVKNFIVYYSFSQKHHNGKNEKQKKLVGMGLYTH